MTTNHYINNVDFNISPEQGMVEDLVVESIKFHGHDFIYIPRTLVNEDEIFGEDTISKFESNHEIEMYIETVDGFGGDGDTIAKFGLQIKDNATLSVAKRRWDEIFRGNPSRPLEGDLLYFPLTKGLFELTFVEFENPFYQVGKNFVYKLTIEQFQFSHEEFDSGAPEVDEMADEMENNNSVENDPFADNESFETEGDLLKEFTPDNPFGDY